MEDAHLVYWWPVSLRQVWPTMVTVQLAAGEPRSSLRLVIMISLELNRSTLSLDNASMFTFRSFIAAMASSTDFSPNGSGLRSFIFTT